MLTIEIHSCFIELVLHIAFGLLPISDFVLCFAACLFHRVFLFIIYNELITLSSCNGYRKWSKQINEFECYFINMKWKPNRNWIRFDLNKWIYNIQCLHELRKCVQHIELLVRRYLHSTNPNTKVFVIEIAIYYSVVFQCWTIQLRISKQLLPCKRTRRKKPNGIGSLWRGLDWCNQCLLHIANCMQHTNEIILF